MAPFYAAALFFYFRAAETRGAGPAALAGLFIGLAFLAKYAAAYFLLGVALAAIFAPEVRLAARQTFAMLAVFALTIAPNVVWNLTHDLATVAHTMDNVGWVRGGSAAAGLNLRSLGDFFMAQFAVFGPVLFAALLWGWVRGGMPHRRVLTAFSLPVLLVVSLQALLSRAYANWAVATYFAGLLIAVPQLLSRARWLLWASLALNGAITLLLPLLAMLAPWPDPKGKPLLSRYLGQAALSRQIIAVAEEAGVLVVVASDRAILADLFYTGRDAGLAFRTPIPQGRPGNYYDQNFAFDAATGPVLFVAEDAPVCGAAPLPAFAPLESGSGAYAGRSLQTYLVPPDCLNALR
jgi:4-amino-4-deoxy-L-arabinose transferase-like glycosyltransferase